MKSKIHGNPPKMDNITERITQLLSNRSAQKTQINDNYIPAAVLVPIFEKSGDLHLLFTKRSADLRDHSGEVSFPGGRYENEDTSVVTTALRETSEEIGLLSKDVKLLGKMEPLFTISGYCITPVVGIIKYPYEFQLNSSEVEYLIEVPLLTLIDEQSLEIREHNISGTTYSVYYYHHDNKDPIWGISAIIVNRFLKIIAPLLKDLDDETKNLSR